MYKESVDLEYALINYQNRLNFTIVTVIGDIVNKLEMIEGLEYWDIVESKQEVIQEVYERCRDELTDIMFSLDSAKLDNLLVKEYLVKLVLDILAISFLKAISKNVLIDFEISFKARSNYQIPENVNDMLYEGLQEYSNMIVTNLESLDTSKDSKSSKGILDKKSLLDGIVNWFEFNLKYGDRKLQLKE